MNISVPGVPRWAVIAAHVVACTVLPSGIWRLLGFVINVPVLEKSAEGNDSLELLDGPVYLVVLTVVSEALAYLAVGLVAPWGERIPRLVPWLGGRRVPVLAAVIPAAIGTVLLTVLFDYGLVMVALHRTIEGGTDVGLHLHSWQYPVFWLCYGPLALWGPLLGVLTVHYYRRRRRAPARPMPDGTGDSVPAI